VGGDGLEPPTYWV